MFKRSYETTIDVREPIRFCVDKERNALQSIKSQYEGRCHGGARIIEVTKILEMSNCWINVSGLDAAGTVNVKFEANVDILSTGDIICPVKVATKEPIIIGVHLRDIHDNNSGDVVININATPEMTTIRKGQMIPILLDRTLHDYKAQKIMATGGLLTAKSQLITYKLPERRDFASEVSSDSTILELVRRINEEKKEYDALNVKFREFFENIYSPEQKLPLPNASEIDIVGIVEGKMKFPEEELYWTRNYVRRSSRMATLLKKFDGTPREENPIVIFRLFLVDIWAYMKLIKNMTTTYNTITIVKDHNNLWQAIRKDAGTFVNKLISGGDEIGNPDVDDSGSFQIETTGGNDDMRFSQDLIDVSKKYGSSFDWGLIKITRDTRNYSLMPWHLKSHNLAIKNALGDTVINSFADLTGHVGIDTINFANLFPSASIIGVEHDPDTCKLYKYNVTLLPNKSEIYCGNSVDIILGNIFKADFVYLDPPWGGQNYKDKLSIDLEMQDLKGKLWKMQVLIKLIFDLGITTRVFLKTPINYDATPILNGPWKVISYNIKNQIGDGKTVMFGKVSYMLYYIEYEDFICEKKVGIVPDCKSGNQFKYIIDRPTLTKSFGQLLNKFIGVDHGLLESITKTPYPDKDIYSLICKQVDNSGFGKSRGAKRFKEIKEWLPREVKSFMDIGAGNCDITMTIAESLGLSKENAIAVDFVGECSLAAKNKVKFELVKPGNKLPAANGEITLVTAFQSLHHIQDLQFKLEEIWRITRPGSVFIIREHNIGNNSEIRPLVDIEHLLYMICFEKMSYTRALEEYYAYYHTRTEWNNMITKFGWKVTATDYSVPGVTNYYYTAYTR